MIRYLYFDKLDNLQEYASPDELSRFLHTSLSPFEDPVDEIMDGLEYAFSDVEGKGGFVILARDGGNTVGALVMLRTGMSGYVPPNILLYIAVKPDCRGQGIGGSMIREAFRKSDGDIKLHVDYDNPARRLYERMGFRSKYAEMRYIR
ncbi:MAG: GNAT family N-acetyltransferase [Candidatus Fermentibacteraceae bacterium]|nr:GNAT family N-acetyltransferase [Candidatus Fermentibacteraceae bacterium]MBN2608624.1 GNAT family N-acetyltransferase [Candidatus Fermentibacteraceae bacterium]